MEAATSFLRQLPNPDSDCCNFFCRNLFLARALDLTWEFLESIETNGIIEPVSVEFSYLEPETPVKFRNGNHRLAAAIILEIENIKIDELWGQIGDAPSGWPYLEYRPCFHDSYDKSNYIMSDPLVSELVFRIADGISDCWFSLEDPCESCDAVCDDCCQPESRCECENY